MAEMRLASQDDAIRHLKLNATQHADDIAHLISIENALADVFEDRCGRAFGVTVAEPVTRRVMSMPGHLLSTPMPIRSVDSITAIHRLDPLDTQVIAATDFFPWGMAADGGYVGIWFMDRIVGDVVLDVTGIWADQDVEGIPADVKEAMTLLVIKTWRRYKSSPTEMVGGDIVAVPTPDGWNDSLVKNAIAHHRVNRRRVGV